MKDINKTLAISPNGDFDLTDDNTTLFQSQDIIIQSDKGKILNSLLLGVGIMKFLNGPTDIISINRDIKSECKKDNIQVDRVQIVNGQIQVNSKNA